MGASIIVTLFLITLGMGLVKVSKNISNTTTDKLIDTQLDISQSEILMKDGQEEKGSDLINFYKKHLGKYEEGEKSPFKITINKKDGKKFEYENGSSIDRLREIGNAEYIKPLSLYKVKVVINKNRVITEVIYSQK